MATFEIENNQHALLLRGSASIWSPGQPQKPFKTPGKPVDPSEVAVTGTPDQSKDNQSQPIIQPIVDMADAIGAVVGGVLSNPLKIVEGIGAILNSADGNNLNKALASQRQISELAYKGGTPISGNGTDVPLRDTPRLVAEYGGNSSDWSKVTSESYTAADGTRFEIHAYRNSVTGKPVEPKSIPVKVTK